VESTASQEGIKRAWREHKKLQIKRKSKKELDWFEFQAVREKEQHLESTLRHIAYAGVEQLGGDGVIESNHSKNSHKFIAGLNGKLLVRRDKHTRHDKYSHKSPTFPLPNIGGVVDEELPYALAFNSPVERRQQNTFPCRSKEPKIYLRSENDYCNALFDVAKDTYPEEYRTTNKTHHLGLQPLFDI